MSSFRVFVYVSLSIAFLLSLVPLISVNRIIQKNGHDAVVADLPSENNDDDERQLLEGGVSFIIKETTSTQYEEKENEITNISNISNDRLTPGNSYTTTTTNNNNIRNVVFDNSTRIVEKRSSDVNDDQGFAACFIMRDDNHLLAEWIAYHYQVLPLRHLIVAVDPYSVTSPKAILDRFRDKLDMEIVLWEDEDYRKEEDIVTAVQEKLQLEAAEVPDQQELTEIHNRRQRNLVGQCLRYHKARGRSWVALTDSDEFIAFNDEYRSSHDDLLRKRQRMLPRAHETSVMAFLNKNQNALIARRWEGCLPMPMTAFGSRVEEEDTATKKNLPEGFVPDGFTTLKYVYHQKKRQFTKVMMDVREFSNEELHPKNIYCVHKPIKNRCHNIDIFSDDDNAFFRSFFRVHHYLGSLQDYVRGNHVHRDIEKFKGNDKEKSEVGPNLELRPWLTAFIDNVGIQTAKELLLLDDADYSKTPHQEVAEKNDDHPSCALLFFGLARRFSDLVLPSVKENIIAPNKGCKIFVHTYNVSVSVEGNTTTPMDSDDSLRILQKLANSYVIETEDDFRRKRDLEYFRKFAPVSPFWTYPSSIDNMIRQWNSIESVWDVMAQYELDHSIKFRRVGFFRLDVQFADKVNIVDDEAPAVIPSLMYASYTPHADYNDRMFYGVREFAKVWATDRFSSVEKYIEWQQTVQFEVVLGLMSESFLHFLLRKKWKIPIVERDICFMRVRGSGEILKDDCNKLGESNSGVIVLGMPRSGDSLLTGLLVEGSDFIIPGNRLGHYEYRNTVLLNEIWFGKQNLSLDHPYKITKLEDVSFLQEVFDPDIPCISNSNSSECVDTIPDTESNLLDETRFDLMRGRRYWILNDPRFSLTLKTWVKFFSAESGSKLSILFIYRQPFEVAKSLKDNRIVPDIRTGLKLWIFYNQMAISNSHGMCRVITSVESVIDNPVRETRRVRNNLKRCGGLDFRRWPVIDPQKILEHIEVHGGSFEQSLIGNFTAKSNDCKIIPPYISDLSQKEEREEEENLFLAAMKVYCDMKNGKAFSPNYSWPSLAAETNPISTKGEKHAYHVGQQQHYRGLQNRSLVVRGEGATREWKAEGSKPLENQEPTGETKSESQKMKSSNSKGTNEPKHTRQRFSKAASAMMEMLDLSVQKRLDLEHKTDNSPWIPLTNFNKDDDVWEFKRPNKFNGGLVA